MSDQIDRSIAPPSVHQEARAVSPAWTDDARALTARGRRERLTPARRCVSTVSHSTSALRVRIVRPQSAAPLSEGLRSVSRATEQRKDGDEGAAIWFWREFNAGWGIGERGSDAGILPLEGRWW